MKIKNGKMVIVIIVNLIILIDSSQARMMQKH